MDDNARLVLKERFDQGLTSTTKKDEIEALSEELNVDPKQIKNFIGNERYRRKRKISTEVCSNPPQKLRHPNAYNCFVKEYIKTPEAQSFNSMSERNVACGEAWRLLEDGEKMKYFEICEGQDSGSINPVFDSGHEMKRVLRNLLESSEWAEKMNIDVCFIVAQNGSDFCGGTKGGRDFLVKNPHISKSFVASLNQSTKPTANPPVTSNCLRKEVITLLNTKYALATAQPNGRVPYKSTRSSDWVGLPRDMNFRHPSAMTVNELRYIQENIADIRYIGNRFKTMANHDHNYSRSDITLHDNQTSTTKQPQSTGTSLLSNISNDDCVYLPSCM